MPTRAFLLALTFFLPSAGAAAQQTGNVAGTVTAVNGGVLAGVVVSARSRTLGVERRATTTPDGMYVIGDLPAEGLYDVQAQIAGFAPVVRAGVTILAGQTATVDFLLKGEIAETVAVSAPAPPLEHDRATVQQIVSERLVHSLPLIGRDFLDLASLTAGFSGNPSFPSPQGQFYWSNNVLVDGGSHFSKWRSAARTFYSGYGLESIKEVQVLTSQFSAEFGEALATVTSVVTNSGTNQLRGTALLFAQDAALNDTPAFTVEKPPASSQRFGLTVGGPIARDATHFFGSYEGYRSRGHNIVVSPAAPGARVPNDEDQHLLFWKLDHKAGSHQLTGRYNGQWFRWHNETGGLALPGTGTQYRNDVHTVFFTDTLLISNRLINQPRVQFARYIDIRRDLQPSVYVLRSGYSVEGGLLGPWGFGADPEDTWEAADTFSLSQGSHSLKFGGGIKHVRAHNTSVSYGNGAYFFAGSVDAYTQPYAFAQGIAPSLAAVTADPRSLGGYGFIQDDWRLRARLTLNVGLRFDAETISNVRGYDVPADKNNFQPRLGLAWDPTGGGHTIVRGGIGLYSQQHLLYHINRVQLEGPGGSPVLTLVPGSPLMPVFPATLPSSIAVFPPRDIQVVDPAFGNPYSLQGSLGFERLIANTLVGVDYVYLNGRALMSLVDTNAPASVLKPANRTVAAADATRPMAPVPNGYRKIIELGNEGESWYHGLQVKVNRAIGPFRTLASYTWASAKDRANYLLPEDSRNLSAEKGRSDNDIRHNLSAGLTWDLPGRGPVSRGWTLSGLGLFRSGRPYNVTWGDDRNGTSQNDARPGERNTAEGQGFMSVDLAAARRLTLRRGGLELRGEMFNVLSRTNYDEYVGVRLSRSFGMPVSAFPRRRLQLAVIARF